MKVLWTPMILAVLLGSLKAPAEVLIHQAQEDETAWFLAELYYGFGGDFPKILKANQMKRPEEVAAGRRLRILHPKFSPQQSNFSERIHQLKEKRRQTMLQRAQLDPQQKVLIPTGEILKKDQHPRLNNQGEGR